MKMRVQICEGVALEFSDNNTWLLVGSDRIPLTHEQTMNLRDASIAAIYVHTIVMRNHDQGPLWREV
jgi:hypothetical protein